MKQHKIQIQLKQNNYSEEEYLTEREAAILKYVLWGYTAKKIGRALNISFRTVEAYIDILKCKLHCHSKGDIIETAIKMGLAKKLDVYTFNKDL